MIKNHTCKILAIGIIVLFIVVGIHPAFAVEDKKSNESLTIDFDNENPVTSSGKIYENRFCYVRGEGDKYCSRFGVLFQNFPISPVLIGDITFGEILFEDSRYFPGEGKIYTNGINGTWEYEGEFRGYNLGGHAYYDTTVGIVNCYTAVEGFIGLYIGSYPSIFIGFAMRVSSIIE